MALIRALFVVVLATVAAAHAQPLPAEIIEKDKPYGPDPRQLLDIAARPLSSLKPAIVVVPGENWQAGDKTSVAGKTKFFLNEGFAVAAINTRVHPDATPRDMAEDVAAAAVWIAKNADRYGIDPRQIYLVGHDSGAHLVSLIGTDPSYLAKHGASPADLGGILSIDAPAYDIPTEIQETEPGSAEGQILREVFGDGSEGGWPTLSPAYQVGKAGQMPPFFIAYPARKPSAYRQDEPFTKALRREGTVSVPHEAIGRDKQSIYRLFGTQNDRMTEAAITFIRREANIPVAVAAKGREGELPDVPWGFAFEAPEEDVAGRRLTGTQVTEIIAHEGRLFAGNAYPGETEETPRGQILRLDAREDRWVLDYQLPKNYTRAASFGRAHFERDFEGRPIEPLDYLFVGSTYERQEDETPPAGVFIRTPSGNWTKQDLGGAPGAEAAHIDTITSWRDPVTGIDLVFLGAAPNPLGIIRGRYDPSQPGGIRFDDKPEFTPRRDERIRGFAQCGSRLYAATDRQIIRRAHGLGASWEPILDFEDIVAVRPYLDDLDIYWQRNYAIGSFRCDTSKKKPTLAFTALNRAFRFSPGDERPIVEADMAGLIRARLGREPHFVQAGQATTIRERGSDLEEWIGLEVYYDPDYLATGPEFPYWRTGFGKEGLYLVRTVIGGQTVYRLEDVDIPGNDPNRRPLARITDFERSPFDKDFAVYVGGFAPWFEDVSNTAWIARGEL